MNRHSYIYFREREEIRARGRPACALFHTGARGKLIIKAAAAGSSNPTLCAAHDSGLVLDSGVLLSLLKARRPARGTRIESGTRSQDLFDRRHHFVVALHDVRVRVCVQKERRRLRVGTPHSFRMVLLSIITLEFVMQVALSLAQLG